MSEQEDDARLDQILDERDPFRLVTAGLLGQIRNRLARGADDEPSDDEIVSLAPVITPLLPPGLEVDFEHDAVGTVLRIALAVVYDETVQTIDHAREHARRPSWTSRHFGLVGSRS